MKLQRKHFPYVIIALLTLVIGTFRYVLFREYPLIFHIGALFAQFLVMSLLWNIIRLVNRQLEKRFSVDNQPATQIFLQVIITCIILTPLFLASYYFGSPLLPRLLEGKAFGLLYVIFFTVVLFLIFGYYSFEFYNKNKLAEEEKLKYRLEAAELAKEKSMLQYHQLRNQVNPHFLFNTFSSLDSLVRSDPALASDFISHLSKVYRYVLDHNNKEVVAIEMELGFIQHYISLLKVRYGNAFKVNINISSKSKERGVVMVTLQLLIDNAIKHNVLHEEEPLIIDIKDEGDYLSIENNKQLKKQFEPSSRQGLLQLRQLYGFLSHHPIIVSDESARFIVKLPLL